MGRISREEKGMGEPEGKYDHLMGGPLGALLFTGKISHVFEMLGVEVEYHTLDVGALTEIAVQCNGLDVYARDRKLSLISIVHALHRVGNYTFGDDTKGMDEKRMWVRQLQEPVQDMLVEEYVKMRQEQRRLVEEKIDELKKLQPTQSAGASGESSVSSPDI
jgi:hypothetical protein